MFLRTPKFSKNNRSSDGTPIAVPSRSEPIKQFQYQKVAQFVSRSVHGKRSALSPLPEDTTKDVDDASFGDRVPYIMNPTYNIYVQGLPPELVPLLSAVPAEDVPIAAQSTDGQSASHAEPNPHVDIVDMENLDTDDKADMENIDTDENVDVDMGNIDTDATATAPPNGTVTAEGMLLSAKNETEIKQLEEATKGEEASPEETPPQHNAVVETFMGREFESDGFVYPMLPCEVCTSHHSREQPRNFLCTRRPVHYTKNPGLGVGRGTGEGSTSSHGRNFRGGELQRIDSAGSSQIRVWRFPTKTKGLPMQDGEVYQLLRLCEGRKEVQLSLFLQWKL
ncbi:hypothetical protein IV203_016774 [Nitzschia inconspicua]|uniref:Uncharacterized protein n=1 Tax=Nitzschia inconspicua TaxID=303405 RepID=A0A9K3KRR1_9STRA|nr:hypothetical protein IV203_016774 [Nitzschia inconspicua]